MKKMILVVENDEDLREAVGSALMHAGFDALGARSARQALSFLDQVAPDLIVLDFLLYEMDGVELTRAIQSRAGLGHTPVLMVTGAPQVARALLLKAGMDIPVLAKPLDTDVLTRTAEGLCASRGSLSGRPLDRPELVQGTGAEAGAIIARRMGASGARSSNATRPPATEIPSCRQSAGRSVSPA